MRNGSALCRWSDSVNSSRLSILPIKVLARALRRTRARYGGSPPPVSSVLSPAHFPNRFHYMENGSARFRLWLQMQTKLRAQWIEELEAMRARLNQMRNALADKLTELGAADRFEFIRRQRGMFSYSGLTAPQVERLRNEFGIYALSTGRICLAALNTENIDTVARAIMRILSTN